MATKTPQICIFDNEKQHFCTLCTCIFHFLIFVDVLVLSTTWNELFCSCVDDVSIWWQMFNFVLLCPKRWFQINSRTFRRHFSSIIALNNWKMIAENRSYIFRWRSRFRRRRVCLSSLLFLSQHVLVTNHVSGSNRHVGIRRNTDADVVFYRILCTDFFPNDYGIFTCANPKQWNQ